MGWVSRVLVEAILRLGLNTSENTNDYVTAPRPFDDVAVEPAIQAISSESATEVEQTCAVLAFGIAGRRDQLSKIVDHLERTAPESELALACSIALSCIPDDNSKVVNLLAPQLSAGKYPFKAHLALLAIATKAALSVAIEHVRHHYDERMATNLAMCEPTRPEALDLIAREVASADQHSLMDVLALPILYLDDASIQQIVAAEPVREALRESALAEEGSFWNTGSKVRAIRAVATFDLATAFLAAQKALENPRSHDRVRYPYLLVDLDEVQSARVLVRQCVREESTAVRHAIARALSRVQVEAEIAALLDAARADERVAGCILCAFRHTSEATRLKLRELLQDVDQEVVEAALTALRSIRRAGYADQLAAVAMAPSIAKEWRWVLLDSLLGIADLGDEGALLPDWLRQLRPVVPADMWEYAKEKLKKRRQKYLDQLRTEDERRR